MSHTDVEAFKQHWSKFVTKVKGKLIKESKKQPLDCELAQQVLTDAKEGWGSSYEANGRWLSEYNEQDYKKGKRIHDILLHKMTFEEIEGKNNILFILLYLIPLVLAAAGFLIAMCFTASWGIRLTSAAIPAVLSVLTARMIVRNIKANRKKQLIADYLEQLNEYSEQIIDIINS